MKAFYLRIETHQILIFIILLCCTGYVMAIRIKDIEVPEAILEGDKVHLKCNYVEEVGSTLYSLKWYKDGQEFYRHQPGISPHTTENRCKDFPVYQVKGINVDCWESTERNVVLTDTSLSTSGQYLCEAIGEHPNFRKAFRNSSLSVYSEPLKPPHIAGAGEIYDPLDNVTLNCSSANSQYIPKLYWFINGKPAAKTDLRAYRNNQTLGLHFQTHSKDFHRGVITVSCVSVLGYDHKMSAQKQLRSSNYLSAQEYQFNAGTVPRSSWLERVTSILILTLTILEYFPYLSV